MPSFLNAGCKKATTEFSVPRSVLSMDGTPVRRKWQNMHVYYTDCSLYNNYDLSQTSNRCNSVQIELGYDVWVVVGV